MHIYVMGYSNLRLPSRLELLNTPTAHLQRGKATPKECPGF